MRSSLLNLIVALLIAALAIGAPLPAKADCAGQGGCTVGAADMTGGCGGSKGEGCKIAQNCAVQLLKMPAQTTIGIAAHASRVVFAALTDETLSSEFVTPETAPPRV